MPPNEYSEMAHAGSAEWPTLKDALREEHDDGLHDVYAEPNCPDCPVEWRYTATGGDA